MYYTTFMTVTVMERLLSYFVMHSSPLVKKNLSIQFLFAIMLPTVDLHHSRIYRIARNLTKTLANLVNSPTNTKIKIANIE